MLIDIIVILVCILAPILYIIDFKKGIISEKDDNDIEDILIRSIISIIFSAIFVVIFGLLYLVAFAEKEEKEYYTEIRSMKDNQ